MNTINKLKSLLHGALFILFASGCSHSLIESQHRDFNISDFTFPADWASNGDAYVLTVYTTQENLTIGSKRKERVQKSLKSVVRQYGSIINNDTLTGNQFALHPIAPGRVSIQGIQSLGQNSRIITRLNNAEICPAGRILLVWFYADTMAQSSGYLSCKKKILSFSDAAQLTAALRNNTQIELPINPLSFFKGDSVPEYVAKVPAVELRTQAIANQSNTISKSINTDIMAPVINTEKPSEVAVKTESTIEHKPVKPLATATTTPALIVKPQEAKKTIDINDIVEKLEALKRRISEEKAQ